MPINERLDRDPFGGRRQTGPANQITGLGVGQGDGTSRVMENLPLPRRWHRIRQAIWLENLLTDTSVKRGAK